MEYVQPTWELTLVLTVWIWSGGQAIFNHWTICRLFLKYPNSQLHLKVSAGNFWEFTLVLTGWIWSGGQAILNHWTILKLFLKYLNSQLNLKVSEGIFLELVGSKQGVKIFWITERFVNYFWKENFESSAPAC